MPATERPGPTEAIVRVLNRAFELDPNAVHSLICNRVPCNAELAQESGFSAMRPTALLGTERLCHQIGITNILDGLTDALGIPRIVVIFDEGPEHPELVGFAVAKGQPNEGSDGNPVS